MNTIKTMLLKYIIIAKRQYVIAQLKRCSYGLIEAGNCGFFGNLFITLNGFRYCEVANVKAVPHWVEENSLYYDPDRGGNAWDYYFEREYNASGHSLLSQSNILRFKPTAEAVAWTYDGMNIRETYGELIQRYVLLKGFIQDKVDTYLSRHFYENNVLGVHLRFTDIHKEARVAIELEDYCKEIDSYLDLNPESLIFIATDTIDTVKTMRKRYGVKCIFQEDCIRSSSANSIHGHYDAGVTGSPYKKGLDVIIDAYLLANSNYLIKSDSRVTAFSLCYNQNLRYTCLTSKIQQKNPLPWLTG